MTPEQRLAAIVVYCRGFMADFPESHVVMDNIIQLATGEIPFRVEPGLKTNQDLVQENNQFSDYIDRRLNRSSQCPQPCSHFPKCDCGDAVPEPTTSEPRPLPPPYKPYRCSICGSSDRYQFQHCRLPNCPEGQ